MKKYTIGCKVYTFDILETHELCGEHKGEICYYGKCRENGKYAWLDEQNGVQFEGESRLIAEPYYEHPFGAYSLWGGQFRPKYNWQKSPVNKRF